MKKYRVAEKHELLKEGITLEINNYDNTDYYSSVWAHNFSVDEFNKLDGLKKVDDIITHSEI